MNQHTVDICAVTSGVACVLGISLSTINAWLTAISLAVSIVAGGIAVWHQLKRLRK